MLILIVIFIKISMRQQEVFHKIGGIIKELNEQYTYVQSVGQLFNDLELELMAANTHFLTDHIEILRKLNKSNEPVMPAAIERITVKNLVNELPETTEVFTDQVEISKLDTPLTELQKYEEVNIIYEFELPEVIRHELTMDDIGGDLGEVDEKEEADLNIKQFYKKAIEPEAVPLQPLPEPDVDAPAAPNLETTFAHAQPEPKHILHKPIAEPVAHTQITVAEKQVLTLNERISAQLAANRKSDFVTVQSISDLKSAVNLNDKLIYIKDLFHGYSLAYSEAIDILNRLNTFAEAEQYLKTTYAIKNNWADKEATANKFYALLQRRYF